MILQHLLTNYPNNFSNMFYHICNNYHYLVTNYFTQCNYLQPYEILRGRVTVHRNILTNLKIKTAILLALYIATTICDYNVVVKKYSCTFSSPSILKANLFGQVVQHILNNISNSIVKILMKCSVIE